MTTQLSTLASKLCPILYFDSQEQYYPCRIQDVDLTNIFTTISDDTHLYYWHDEAEKYITYVVFYQQDGGIHGIGTHKYDIEFVRVFYDENCQPTRYYLSEHGRDQGLYIAHDKVKKDKVTGRAVFYIAKKTHANYPSAGIWVRGFCFANDVTAEDVRWDPCKSLEAITDPSAISQKFGDGHMQWYAATQDIAGAPTSWYFWYRFFYPLSKKWRALP